MKAEANSKIGKRLLAAAEEEVWTRAVIRATFLIGLAFAAAWWWRDQPWPGGGAFFGLRGEASDMAQRQAAYLGWAVMAILVPAYYAFWARNRSLRAWRTWRSHWTLGFWVFVLHFGWSTFLMYGWGLPGRGAADGTSVFPLVLALGMWWIGDITLASRQGDETRLAGAQRLLLSVLVLALMVRTAFADGAPLFGMILCATLVASAVISAQDAWKKRGRT